jgi:hypothetical protein
MAATQDLKAVLGEAGSREALFAVLRVEESVLPDMRQGLACPRQDLTVKQALPLYLSWEPFW